MQELLEFFPFVSYSYYFPKKSLLDPELFDTILGLAVVSEYRKKYEFELPVNATKHPDTDSLTFTITKDMNSETITYDDFEPVRQYAKENNIELTGEAIGYCVFSNYQKDNAVIKIVIYLFTNNLTVK